MKRSSRLTSEKRRHAIVDAVRGVFAAKGFSDTTTRELAHAAGVSEALLYKHFPSKESLYAAMLDGCTRGPSFIEFQRILALKPSTATLIVMVHFAMVRFVYGRAGDADKHAMDRLTVRSLLGDADFARLAYKKFADAWVAKFGACLNAAAKSGDLRQVPVRRNLRVWFAHHVAFSVMLHLLPRMPAIDYRASNKALVEQATWFALLGAGVKEKAIKRHYNSRTLKLPPASF
jgi:AcrR family transcriptional regulator